MALWYLRRAVPWSALLGCLATAGVLVGLAHWKDSTAGVALPLVALLSVAAAGFTLDEPALTVASVTPRSDWAQRLRLSTSLLPLACGLGMLVAAPGSASEGDWALVLAGLGGAIVLLASLGVRRGLARPGAALASGVVLVGLAPLVMGLLIDVPALYPLPGLTDRATSFWTLVLLASLSGLAWVAMAGGRPPVRSGRR